jgi:hypothetical protein
VASAPIASCRRHTSRDRGAASRLPSARWRHSRSSGGGEARITDAHGGVRFHGVCARSASNAEPLYLDSGPPGASLVIRDAGRPGGANVGTRYRGRLVRGRRVARPCPRAGWCAYDRGKRPAPGGRGRRADRPRNDGTRRRTAIRRLRFGADWAWVVRGPRRPSTVERSVGLQDRISRLGGARERPSHGDPGRSAAPGRRRGSSCNGSNRGHLSVVEALDVILPDLRLTYRYRGAANESCRSAGSGRRRVPR